MVLRIVSGLLMPKSGHKNSGDVTIELKSNSIVDGSQNARIVEGCTYGGDTHYDSEPCKAVSIRYFDGQPDSINLTDGFQNGFREVKISWDCNDGEIKEITYFFAGEE
jgi:hypothetical protein